MFFRWSLKLIIIWTLSHLILRWDLSILQFSQFFMKNEEQVSVWPFYILDKLKEKDLGQREGYPLIKTPNFVLVQWRKNLLLNTQLIPYFINDLSLNFWGKNASNRRNDKNNLTSRLWRNKHILRNYERQLQRQKSCEIELRMLWSNGWERNGENCLRGYWEVLS
jgi:hypothetical protein